MSRAPDTLPRPTARASWALPAACALGAAAVALGGLDTALFRVVNGWGPGHEALWTSLTMFGEGYVVLALFASAIGRRPSLLWAGVLGALLALATSHALKDLLALDRPARVLDGVHVIGELLKRRSNEGVDVRVLLDGLGTIISTIEKQATLPEDHRGPASVRRFLERDSGIEVRQAVNPWLTGDHVKTAIIDSQLAFTGGMNIAREYRYDWHDLMTELSGPVVDVLQYEFEKAWAHAGLFGDLNYLAARLRPKPDGADAIGYPIRVLFTRPHDHEIFRAQREAVRNAQKYIYVENAYFTDDAMLHELAHARRRGVDVRVIMPLVTDRGPITRSNALAANAMLEHGVRVYIYPGMSHIKAAVFDGWACIGSANWDRWSFRINKELNIATSHPDAVAELERRVFETDFSNSVEMTEPFPERWTDHLIEVVGDYIF